MGCSRRSSAASSTGRLDASFGTGPLTPVGGWFANMEAGDFELPWASIPGFAGVLGLMTLVIWLAYKHQYGRPAGRQRLRPTHARR